MSASIPPALKPIKSILLRANELSKSNVPQGKLVSYCCRRYAIMKALSDPEMKQEEPYLMGLLEQLEQDKQSLNSEYGDLMKDKPKQLVIVKKFGTNVFRIANKAYVDRKATIGTARSFVAAGIYLEVAAEGSDDESIHTLKKVSRFNAMEISRAIKDGREPLPPLTSNDDEGEFEGGDEAPVGADAYGFDAGLPAAPTGEPDFLGLPPAPTDVYVEEEEEEKDEFYRPNDMAKLPANTVARNLNTFEDVVPRFGALPPNAKMSTRGKEFLRTSTGLFKGAQTATAVRSDSDCVKAEQLTRDAASEFKKNNYMQGIENICKALKILEKRKPPATIPSGGVSPTAQKDVVEYLLFAARTLECAGDLVPVPDAKRRAIDLLSNALQTAQRG